MISFKCPECGSTAPINTYDYRCSCGSPWGLEFDPEVQLSAIRKDIFNIWRYKSFLPFQDDFQPVSLGEGWTPLLSLRLDNQSVLIKPEWFNPSGSFKDRGAAVLVNFLKQQQIDEAMDDSSGNAGAALAAYCAHLGIKCHIFSPSYASGGKVSQIKWYGAQLNLIEGTRKDVSLAIQSKTNTIYYASHNFHPYFLEGLKTLAYEICEQTNWDPPQHIIIPLGYGGLYLGLMKGFIDCYKSGLIDRIPHVHGIQSERYAPIYHAIKNGMSYPVNWETHKTTVAEGIAAATPYRGKQIIFFLKKYRGIVETVNEEEILVGLKKLSKLGLFVEPTSAVVLEGFRKLKKNGHIQSVETVLLILTGTGLKAYHKLDSLFEK